MKITLIGIIAILLSIYGFVKDEKFLLKLVVFFSTFTAAAAFIIPKYTIAFSIYKIPMFLWMLKILIMCFKNRKKINIELIKNLITKNKIFKAILFFCISIILSTLYLYLSKMNFSIYDSFTNENINIKFSFSNIKQVIGTMEYLIFCLMLSIRLNDKKLINSLMKVFIASSLFAVLWGVIQILLHCLNIKYPAFLFNNNPYLYQGYDQIVRNIKRISSIALEPSTLSFNLLCLTSILLAYYIVGKNNQEKKYTYFLIITTAITIMTTSSTALFGLVIIYLISLIQIVAKRKKTSEIFKFIGISIFSIILSAILMATSVISNNYFSEKINDSINNLEEITEEENDVNENMPNIELENDTDKNTTSEFDKFSSTMIELTIKKFQTGSAFQRLNREKIALEGYKKSIIFGLGYCSFRTYTLFTNLLVNIGIVGLISFVYILIVVFVELFKQRKKDNEMYLIFTLSIIGMLIPFIISIPDINYLYFWIVIICAYKYFTIEENKKAKKGLIIGIDARGLDGNRTGITTYIEEVIKKLNEIKNDNNTYILYSTRKIDLNFELKDNFIIKDNNLKLGTLRVYFEYPKMLQEDGVDVFWGTQHLLPMRNYYSKDIKLILTVHDLAIHKLKTVGSFKNTIIQRLFLKTSSKNADLIMADSKSTKNDLIDLFKIEENKIEVVYLGTNFDTEYSLSKSNESKILKKFNVQDKNYLFFISTIEPRKNIPTLIKAFETYRDNNIKDNLKLILAGGLGWKYEEVLNLIENSKYKKDIQLPGYISKDEKKCLFHNTKCFVYPSLYEGFGLPILEAMSNNALVITSNISSIPEVGKDAATYINNVLDYNELASVIQKTLNLSINEKNKLISKGNKIVKEFTWEKCTKEIVYILTGSDK